MLRRAAVRPAAPSSSPGHRWVSLDAEAASGLVLALFLVRGFRGFGKLCIGLELLDRLLGITIIHRLLEAAHRGSQVRADGLELLRPEDQQHHDQNDNEFFETDW